MAWSRRAGQLGGIPHIAFPAVAMSALRLPLPAAEPGNNDAWGNFTLWHTAEVSCGGTGWALLGEFDKVSWPVVQGCKVQSSILVVLQDFVFADTVGIPSLYGANQIHSKKMVSFTVCAVVLSIPCCVVRFCSFYHPVDINLTHTNRWCPCHASASCSTSKGVVEGAPHSRWGSQARLVRRLVLRLWSHTQPKCTSSPWSYPTQERARCTCHHNVDLT